MCAYSDSKKPLARSKEGVFGGKFEFEKLFPVERLSMTLLGYDTSLDYVNTAIVTSWAEEIKEEFK